MNHYTDANGIVQAIFCTYHKKWECPQQVEFSALKASKTGLAYACKEGASKAVQEWKRAKQNKPALGELDATGLPKPVQRADGHGSESLDDLLATLDLHRPTALTLTPQQLRQVLAAFDVPGKHAIVRALMYVARGSSVADAHIAACNDELNC
ncbi:hypothetical protein ZHX_gp3 [Edwardsiella phage vB_EpP_ZHX]|nr:hypothetical protein ZHX_gp3 [Edwardsiella phage vB_EpP_ZHX]